MVFCIVAQYFAEVRPRKKKATVVARCRVTFLTRPTYPVADSATVLQAAAYWVERRLTTSISPLQASSM
jgi:hypothetical protein